LIASLAHSSGLSKTVDFAPHAQKEQKIEPFWKVFIFYLRFFDSSRNIRVSAHCSLKAATDAFDPKAAAKSGGHSTRFSPNRIKRLSAQRPGDPD